MIPCTSPNKPRIRRTGGHYIAFPGRGPRPIVRYLLARAVLFCTHLNARLETTR